MYQIANIYVIASISVVGGALFGFDISSMSAQLNENSYTCYFKQDSVTFKDDAHLVPDGCSGLSSLHQGGVTAAMPAGSWLGALISGFISDRLGRRPSIIIGCWVWYALLSSPFLLLLLLLALGNGDVTTDEITTQVHRVHAHLRRPECRHAGGRSGHQRHCRRYRVVAGARVH